MFETERLEKIQEILAENGALSVQRLARALFVSESTVRRDLSELQRQGLVKRIHGGAVLITGASRELPLYMRERDHPDAKERIAEQAVSYIRDGQVLFLDASSTVQKMVGRLAAFRDLTIITNGLKTAQELSQLPHTIYCTGGLLLHSSHAYVGHGAERAVREYNADLFFFSSRGNFRRRADHGHLRGGDPAPPGHVRAEQGADFSLRQQQVRAVVLLQPLLREAGGRYGQRPGVCGGGKRNLPAAVMIAAGRFLRRFQEFSGPAASNSRPCWRNSPGDILAWSLKLRPKYLALA